MKTTEPIDAVITWVNGQDPVHQQKRHVFLKKNSVEGGASPTRFNQANELFYCIHSLFRFAPWVRKIFLVTDKQTPDFLATLTDAERAKIECIDHTTIFKDFEAYLPTFNSLTIEMMLWRIPGLAAHFIYLNDDCMLTAPVAPSDFFRGDKVVLRGQVRGLSNRKFSCYFKKILAALRGKSWQPSLEPFRQVQENTAKLMGLNYFIEFLHAPHALRKATFAHFFAANEHLIFANLAYRFRDPQQYWVLAWVHYFELKQCNVSFDEHLKALYINPDFHTLEVIEKRLRQANQQKNLAFACIQSLDQASTNAQIFITDWLKKRVFA